MQALFSSLQKNSHHVLHRLLPAKSTQSYNLRRRRHSFSLTQKQSSYDDCNFITRMLFYHIYWLNYFLALPRISLFHCAACHTWLLCMYVCMYVCNVPLKIFQAPATPCLALVKLGSSNFVQSISLCSREYAWVSVGRLHAGKIKVLPDNGWLFI